MLPTTHARSYPAMTLALATLIFLGCGSNEATSAEPQTTKWVLPIAAAKDQANLDEPLKRLQEVLQNEFIWYQENGNPVCAFWVEITGGKPNPGDGGYVMIIQRGGAVLRATDVEQLQLAIDRIKEVRQVKKDGVYLPIGLLTNYPVIESPNR